MRGTTDKGLIQHLKSSKPGAQKQLLAKALAERLRRRAQNDINAFCLYILDWDNQWFHKEWHEAIDKYEYTLIISPRDHGKSSQISVARVLFELGRNPNLRIKIVSQSDDRASNILSEITEHMRSNKKLHEIFPNLKPAHGKPWTSHKIYVQRDLISKDPSIESLGVLSTATGARADLIIFDDVVDFRNAIQNPKLREVVKEAFFSVWVNLLEPDGRLVYVCTLWHQDDLSHALMAMEAYHTVFFSIPEGSFEPIWEDKWPEDQLRKRCAEVGTREFDRSFRNIALSAEDTLFKLHFIEGCYRSVEHAPKGLRYFAGVDLAGGKSKKSKFNVIFILGVDRKGLKWREKIIRGRFTSPQVAKLIVSEHDKYKFDVIMVENNAYQIALLEWLTEMNYRDLPVKGFTTGKNKLDLQIGLPSLAVEFENKSWAIPRAKRHAPTCNCHDCQWIRELTNYPIGRTTDIIMAQWLAREGARMGYKGGSVDRW